MDMQDIKGVQLLHPFFRVWILSKPGRFDNIQTLPGSPE